MSFFVIVFILIILVGTLDRMLVAMHMVMVPLVCTVAIIIGLSVVGWLMTHPL